MTDMIWIIVIMVFAYFVAKKHFIPRIAAKRAAKRGETPETGIIDTEAVKIREAKETAIDTRRPVILFDMRLVDVSTSEAQHSDESLYEYERRIEQDIRNNATEMLFSLPVHSKDVQFDTVKVQDVLILYVTYTV